MADTESDIVAVSVFNLASNAAFNIGDAVAIPEPFVQVNDFEFNNQVHAIIRATTFISYEVKLTCYYFVSTSSLLVFA